MRGFLILVVACPELPFFGPRSPIADPQNFASIMTSSFFQPTRRGFLRGSALAATAPAILGRTRKALNKNDADVLKVGLVGCGGRGSGAALQAMQAEEGTVVLTAMADIFPERIEQKLQLMRDDLMELSDRVQVDEDHKFVGFDAYKKVMESDVDVVILTTPPHFRPAHIEAAVAAGKHIFAEKPCAVDAPGVRRVLESAKRAKAQNTALMSGFCWRYKFGVREVYSRIQAGEIGELRAVYSTYNAGVLGKSVRKEGWSDMEWQLRNWWHFLWLSGDHIAEQACHSLDKMAYAFGDVSPLSCVAVGGRQARTGAESGNVYDHFGVTYDYPNGAKGFHMSRQIAGCNNDNSDWAWGEKANATIDCWGNRHRFEGQVNWTYDGPDNNMYQTEHDELFASIRAGKPVNDGTWFAHSSLLAIMGRMAAYTGQRVTWDEAMNSKQVLGPKSYDWGQLGMNDVPTPGKTKLV